MATADDLKEYYANLLIAQYYNKQKARATIKAMVSGPIADSVYLAVRDGFDLETAVGKQLDVLGKLVGVPRYFFTLDVTKDYLQITTYGAGDMGTVNGLATYVGSQPPSWYTMTYEDFVQHTLSDADYRRVLQFQAQVRSCDYSYSKLDSICYAFFKGNVNLISAATMTITYQHLTSDPDGLFEIVSQMGLLPKPAGVSVSVQEVAHF